MASGIMYAGTGAGGTVFPFIVQALLKAFGYKLAMISLVSSDSVFAQRTTSNEHYLSQGLGFFAIGAIAIIPVKPRVPIGRPRTTQETSSSSDRSHARPKVNWSFLRRNTFYAFGGSILFSSLGNFLPTVWIPSRSPFRILDRGNSSETILQRTQRTWVSSNPMVLPYLR